MELDATKVGDLVKSNVVKMVKSLSVVEVVIKPSLDVDLCVNSKPVASTVVVNKIEMVGEENSKAVVVSRLSKGHCKGEKTGNNRESVDKTRRDKFQEYLQGLQRWIKAVEKPVVGSVTNVESVVEDDEKLGTDCLVGEAEVRNLVKVQETLSKAGECR